MNSKVLKESKDESFHFDEEITEKLDFIINNGVGLHFLDINLLENDGIELPDESPRTSKTELQEELSRLQNELILEKEANNKPGSQNDFNNEFDSLMGKIETAKTNLTSFVDSFKPLILSKKSHMNSNIQELHLKPDLVRKQYRIVKSVFETTENARGAKNAIRQIDNAMKKF